MHGRTAYPPEYLHRMIDRSCAMICNCPLSANGYIGGNNSEPARRPFTMLDRLLYFIGP